MRRYLLVLLMLLLSGTALAKPLPSIAEASQGMQAYPGFIRYYWDAQGGRMLLQIERFDAPWLYLASLASGLGSNDVGLDRGQLGTPKVVRFKRVGPKVLLVQDNLAFRANSENPDERRAVVDAFATSVLASLKIVAQDPGAVLVDATDFLLSDQHRLIARLRETKQGDFKLDKARSAIWMPGSRNFPDNTVIEVLLTLTSVKPGPQVRAVTPTPQALTLRQQHSFIRLPDDHYQAREYDPRSGFFAVGYADYAAGLNRSIHQRLLVRHRFKPGQKLVYYVDRGAPEPVRSALMEGAGWWAQAFAAAGFPDAFEVRLLPEGVDPLDIRYNVIQWVHRVTRGWSYGSSIVDPRTGEIIQGHISLGSLRVRQDMRIARSLVQASNVAAQGDAAAQRMALARLRQLAVHEVGHTLGLAHNFAASPSNRASVMDYPYPDIGIDPHDRLVLDHAYATGVGAWDKLAIQIGYGDPRAKESVAQYVTRLRASRPDLRYLSDPDARALNTAQATASLWDNGADPLAQLQHVLRVRRLALASMSIAMLRPGEPLFELQHLLTPIYLYHRYQVEATAKLVGGRKYNYAVRGGQVEEMAPVQADRQHAAITALVAALDPKTLAIPRRLLNALAPPPPGYRRDRELLSGFENPVFDPVAAAQSATRVVLSALLNPARAARLYEQHAADDDQPGLAQLLDVLLRKTVRRRAGRASQKMLLAASSQAMLDALMGLVSDASAAPPVRSIALARLLSVQTWLGKNPGRGDALRAWRKASVERIRRFRTRAWDVKAWPAAKVPPGSPI